MKSKLFTLLGVLLLTVACTLMVACDGGEEPHVHAYTEEVIAPTCTEDGYTIFTCACNDTYTGNPVPALNHDTQSHAGQAATCTEDGWEDYVTCKRAGCNYTTYTAIQALNHDTQSHAGQAATCTEDGWEDYETCKRAGCEYTTYTTIEALKHDLEDHPGQTATCTEDGWEDYQTCKRAGCNHTTYTTIEALKHDLEDHPGQAATCTEDGWEDYQTCKRTGCNHTTYTPIEALKHDIKSHLGQDATCTEAGWEDYEACDRVGCGYTTYKEIQALKHDLKDHPGQAATCTEDGWEDYQTCERAGCEYTTYKAIGKKGHTTAPRVEAPTCTEPGYTYHECTDPNCNYYYKTNETPATGHKRVGDWLISKSYHYYVCACGQTVTKTHNFSQGLCECGAHSSIQHLSYKEVEGGIGITGYNPNSTAGTYGYYVYVPKYIEGKPVVELCEKAFYYDGDIGTLILQEGLLRIGEYALYGCSKLTDVEIPSTVVSVASNAFLSSSNLTGTEKDGGIYLGNSAAPYTVLLKVTDKTITSFTMQDGTRFVQDSVFSGCSSLVDVTFSDDLIGIGCFAFMDCTSLKQALLPDGLLKIGERAFEDCTSMTQIRLPSTLATFGSEMFSGCPALDGTVYENGLYIGNENNPYMMLIEMIDTTAKAFVFHPDVKAIGCYAFYYAEVTSVVIPEGVVFLDAFSFQRAALKSVVIPSTITQYGRCAFYYCTSLTTVILTDGLTIVGDRMFADCSGLTSIHIPASVELVDMGAFTGCTYLYTVVFEYDSALKEIGSRAFGSFSSYSKLYFGGTVEEFNKVKIDWINDASAMYSATYYYYSETQPTEEGNYWHYDTDGVTPVKW